jgi:hypothetical protein
MPMELRSTILIIEKIRLLLKITKKNLTFLIYEAYRLKATERYIKFVIVRVKSPFEQILSNTVIKKYSWTGKSGLNTNGNSI